MPPRTPRRTMPRRAATGPRRCATLLTTVVLALAVAVRGAASAPPSPPTAPPSSKQCCASGVTISQRICSDGTPMALNCSIVFRINPAEDEADAFTLTADGAVLHLGNMTVRHFCLMGDNAYICHEEAPEIPDPRPQWWFDVASALSWVSVTCLALTLFAHVLLPDLRDLQGRCHMGAVASLGLGLLMLAVLQTANLEAGMCTTMAFLAYYWLLSAFFWLNVTSFNVWRSVVLEHVRFQERTLFAWYCVVGWGAPLAVLLLLLSVHLLPDGSDDVIVRPRFGDSKCWFHDDRATWAWFYWPLAVLLTMNVVYFLWTTARLWQQYGDSGGNQCRRKLLRRRCLLSLKLFLIMGISWTFELISSAADVPGYYAWYVTDMFNAMQGVVILLVLVLVRRRVWRALHKRHPCGFRPPESWAYPSDMRNYEDDVCATSTDTEDEEEEVDDHHHRHRQPRRHQELNDMSPPPATAASRTTNGNTPPKVAGSHPPR